MRVRSESCSVRVTSVAAAAMMFPANRRAATAHPDPRRQHHRERLVGTHAKWATTRPRRQHASAGTARRRRGTRTPLTRTSLGSRGGTERLKRRSASLIDDCIIHDSAVGEPRGEPPHAPRNPQQLCRGPERRGLGIQHSDGIGIDDDTPRMSSKALADPADPARSSRVAVLVSLVQAEQRGVRRTLVSRAACDPANRAAPL